MGSVSYIMISDKFSNLQALFDRVRESVIKYLKANHFNKQKQDFKLTFLSKDIIRLSDGSFLTNLCYQIMIFTKMRK